ncbi:hypothetical protein [Gordoniibacillus kamchatkensis]|nr:hypothetical protein [Paenibacillus sp. VKM B-2647]
MTTTTKSYKQILIEWLIVWGSAEENDDGTMDFWMADMVKETWTEQQCKEFLESWDGNELTISRQLNDFCIDVLGVV